MASPVTKKVAASPNSANTRTKKAEKPRLSNEIVTLYAGKAKSAPKFLVHRSFATHYSTVLKAAFESDFVEGKTQTYRFSDASKEVLELLTHWFYTQDLDLNDEAVQVHNLCKLWVLADEYLIPKLQNQILLAIDNFSKQHQSIYISSVKYLWKNTAPGSGIRRLFLHHCAYWMAPEIWSDKSDEFPKEMLIEFATLVCTNALNETARSQAIAAFKIQDLFVSEDV
ncbi:hypothetical protein B0O99DRAFT_598794 [Bisporella sp. PMI_857]|nr:hypothetical protein B0O99DRAFT_598794 [Bisporella sp. PMI_857]